MAETLSSSTNEEKAAINALKKSFEGDMESDLYEDDHMFYRFLKARDFKIDIAENMLRKHLEWRKKYDIKNIFEFDPPEVLKMYAPLNFIGYTKEGCIVRYSPTGNLDCRGIWASCTDEQWHKHLFKIYETDLMDIKDQCKRIGKPMGKFIYIHNLKNFTFAKATDKRMALFTLDFCNMFQDNYPETLWRLYVINAPKFFGLIHSFLKSFLSSQIIQKIHIYSDDSFKKDLLEIMDAEVLPAFLGGERTDPDGNPLCTTFINHGGLVPETYYRRSKDSFKNFPGVQRESIYRSTVHEIYQEISIPGTYLEWEFMLISGDVKFGIMLRDDVGSKVEVVPLQKMSTNDYTETGFHKCEVSGTYIVVFDNSYSVLRSKDVYYKIRTIPPRNETCY